MRLKEAPKIYVAPSARHSAGHNLILEIGPTQLQLGQTQDALASFRTAAKIGQAINLEPLTEYAQQKIQEIQNSSD